MGTGSAVQTGAREIFVKGQQMVNDNLVKCPVCGGFTHVDKPELLAALNDPKIREQIEKYVAELVQSPSGELAVVATGQPHGGDFNKDVHKWNPNVPVWRRSPKE
ncbi:MAG: hypothetical protein WBC78_15245 [Candidatus Sulfotelmatobacter sp.]